MPGPVTERRDVEVLTRRAAGKEWQALLPKYGCPGWPQPCRRVTSSVRTRAWASCGLDTLRRLTSWPTAGCFVRWWWMGRGLRTPPSCKLSAWPPWSARCPGRWLAAMLRVLLQRLRPGQRLSGPHGLTQLEASPGRREHPSSQSAGSQLLLTTVDVWVPLKSARGQVGSGWCWLAFRGRPLGAEIGAKRCSRGEDSSRSFGTGAGG